MLHRFYLGTLDSFSKAHLIQCLQERGVSNVTITQGTGLIRDDEGYFSIEESLIIDAIDLVDDSRYKARIWDTVDAIRDYLCMEKQECALWYRGDGMQALTIVK